MSPHVDPVRAGSAVAVKALDGSVDASIPRQRYAETLAGGILEVEHQMYQDAAARVVGGKPQIDQGPPRPLLGGRLDDRGPLLRPPLPLKCHTGATSVSGT